MLKRIVSGVLFASVAAVVVACAASSSEVDNGGAPPKADGGAGVDKDGSGPQPPPVVEEQCAQLTPSTLPSADEVCVVEKGTGTSVLYVGDVLRPGKVFSSGQVLVDELGAIACVGCDCASKATDATKVICPDAVISPGLINAHDHGAWVNGAPATTANLIVKGGGKFTGPPDPARIRFEHRNDWRASGNSNNPKIDDPGGQATTDQKIFGDVRMALGGAVMTFQSTAPAKFLRVADDTKQGYFPDNQPTATYETFPIGSSVQVADDPSNPDCGKYQFKTPPPAGQPWIPHVSEGIDVDARNEFLCLTDAVSKGRNYLDARSAIIHGVGLTTMDIARMAQKGVKLIWSPRSNISLYGETARVTEFDKLGVTIGLGTDWLPSGSMNVLRELVCADQFNKAHLGGYFSDEKLWLMATKGAATALGFDGVTGELTEGKLADIAIFAKRGRKAYRAVIDASEKEVALVVRGGKVLVGSSSVVAALETDCDELEVCGVKKRVCISRDTGKRWDAIGSLPNMYALASCGQPPPNEPTCVPERTLDSDRVKQSTAYTGMSSADDQDGDGVPDSKDNCPTMWNPARPLDNGAQENSDGDDFGDVCDPCPFDKNTSNCKPPSNDTDGDGIDDPKDNCVSQANPGQGDADGDGFGDACDPCPNQAGAVGGCPAATHTIAEAWALGNNVQLQIESVCVTAVKPSTRMWIQDPNWTNASATSGGLFVFFGGGSIKLPTGVKAGDLVTIEGKTTTYQGAFELTSIKSFTVVEAQSSKCTDAALVKPVTLAQIQQGGADETKYRFMLVKIINATSDGPDATSGTTPTRFQLQGSSLKVTNFLAGSTAFTGATFPSGTVFTEITGVLDFHTGNQLAPRARVDIKP